MADPTIETMRRATMTKAKTLRTMYGRILVLFYWNVVFDAIYDELALGEIDGYESGIPGSGDETEMFHVLIELIRPVLDVRKGDRAGENLDLSPSELRSKGRRIENLRGHLIERVLIEKIFSLEFEYEGRSFSGHSLPNPRKTDVPSAIGDFRVDIRNADGESRNDVAEVFLNQVLFDEDQGPGVHRRSHGCGIDGLGIRRRRKRRTVAQVRVEEIIREDVNLVFRIFGRKAGNRLEVFVTLVLERYARISESLVLLSARIEHDVSDEIPFVRKKLERELAPADDDFYFVVAVLVHVVLDLQRGNVESVEFGKVLFNFVLAGVFFSKQHAARLSRRVVERKLLNVTRIVRENGRLFADSGKRLVEKRESVGNFLIGGFCQ